MKLLQQGFSLIELMIVIVIIGILGSVAIPTYKEYVVRAKVTEFFSIVQPIKLAVTEALLMSTPKEKIDNKALGLDAMAYPKNISEVKIANAIITITGNPKALDLPIDQVFTIALTPIVSQQGMISWDCTTKPDTHKKYAPSNCRD